MSNQAKMERAIQEAVRTIPTVETLEERGHDSLDFNEISVSCLREALESAYKAGRKDEETRAEKCCLSKIRT